MTTPAEVARSIEYLRSREVGQSLARIAFDARPLQPKTRHWGVSVVIDTLKAALSNEFNFIGLSPRYSESMADEFWTWRRIPKCNTALFELSPLLFRDFDLYWGANHFLPAALRKPSVVTVHDMVLFRYPGEERFSRVLGRRILSSARRAHRIITDSQTTADDLIKLCPDVRRKVDVGLLGYVPTEHRLSGPADSMPYVMVLGAHRPRKHVDLAIRAVAGLRERGTKLKLIVTGDVHHSFQQLVNANRNFVEVTGVLPKQRVFELLASSHALLFPSTYEGFGFPILDAMSVRCPVIALDTPINKETGGTAAAYLPDDPLAWSSMIADMLKAPARRTEMIESGLSNLKRFSWQRTADLYAETFRSVLD
jgi:glycosyltransferase involved in cell wall biosynthesis